MIEYKITSDNPTIEETADIIMAAVIKGDEMATRIVGYAESGAMIEALAELVADTAIVTGHGYNLLSWVHALATSSLAERIAEGEAEE